MLSPMQYVLFNNMYKRNVYTIVNEFTIVLRNTSGKCMDIGSGPGDITKNILLPALDPSATMIGIDAYEKMIVFANGTYGNEKLKFEVLDIQTKNLPEKYILKFDHIFSFNVLQWCNDIRQTFENIYRMLRPGKTMLISCIACAPLFEYLQFVAQDARFAQYMGDKKKYVGIFHYSSRPDEELKRLLENIGFQVHHCSHEKINNLTNIDEYISIVTSQYTFKFVEDMPHYLREEFKNVLKRQFTDIPSKYTMLVAYAEKCFIVV